MSVQLDHDRFRRCISLHVRHGTGGDGGAVLLLDVLTEVEGVGEETAGGTGVGHGGDGCRDGAGIDGRGGEEGECSEEGHEAHGDSVVTSGRDVI